MQGHEAALKGNVTARTSLSGPWRYRRTWQFFDTQTLRRNLVKENWQKSMQPGPELGTDWGEDLDPRGSIHDKPHDAGIHGIDRRT